VFSLSVRGVYGVRASRRSGRSSWAQWSERTREIDMLRDGRFVIYSRIVRQNQHVSAAGQVGAATAR
jgi:hypothetical protein